MKDSFLENAEELNRLEKNIHETVKNRNKSKEEYQLWKESTKVFHEHYNELAFPGGLQEFINLLNKGDGSAISKAIDFLETDPRYFRSGYIKEEIIDNLKKHELSKKDKLRLQKIILHVIDTKYCREFRRYCRLSKKLISDDFRNEIEERLNSENSDIVKRANWLYKYIS